jgi:hypothetical protein
MIGARELIENLRTVVSEQDNFGECEVQIATNSRDLAISAANHLTNPLSIEPRTPRHFSGPETIMRP